MSELVFLVEEAPEGGYTARALGESIFTEADTLAELHEMILDAVRCHYDEGARVRFVQRLRAVSRSASFARTILRTRSAGIGRSSGKRTAPFDRS